MPVDASAALDLKLNHHLSYSEIAAIQVVTKQAIHGRIKNLLPPAELDTYKNHRADILAGLQAKILSNLDEDRLSKASAYQLVGSAMLLHDHERLERNLSTGNLAIIHADIAALRAKGDPNI
jgi:predicted DNA-binding protein YlxM (UPF0122 family)